MSSLINPPFLRSAHREEVLTALRADHYLSTQIVSRNWLPKRCAFGPMAPLNLRKGAASNAVDIAELLLNSR